MLDGAEHLDSVVKPPRYLRFLRTLVLGSAIAGLPMTAACSDDCEDAECSEGWVPLPPDAGPVAVDGPLPPPDLPKLA